MQPGAELNRCIFIFMMEHWTECSGLHRENFEQKLS